MGGGLIQLAAMGQEDLYLTDNPQITFFKIIYKRYTNFATEPIPQFFTTTTPNFGERVTCTITRNADLISKTYVVVDLPAVPQFYDINGEPSNVNVFAWVKKIGFNIIQSAELEIDGKTIDKHYGDWLNIWYELTVQSNLRALDYMIGNIPELYDFSNGKNGYRLYIPLNFYFCRYDGLALPLIALHYSTVKIHIEFKPFNQCYIVGPTNSIPISQSMVTYKPYEYIYQTINNTTVYGIFINFDISTKSIQYIALNGPFVSPNNTNPNFDYTIYGMESKGISTPVINSVQKNINIVVPNLSISNAFLLVNFIYLDSEERLKFAKSSHEYLIDQLLIQPETSIFSNTLKLKLGFNHPCKEIVFRGQIDYISNGPLKDKFNYTNFIISNEGNNIIRKARLLLNGNERFSEQSGDYFSWVQPYQYHSKAPSNGINVYSFCLNPENHQPSGSLNFSKIDDISLELAFDSSITFNNAGKIQVYAVVYNVLRIINGLGGLAFSN